VRSTKARGIRLAASRCGSDQSSGARRPDRGRLADGTECNAIHVYTRSGVSAVGVIVETAREALAKAPEFFEEGHREVIFKDLLGNVLDRAVVMTMAEIEDKQMRTNGRRDR
jgi:hypothetical protein